MSKVAPMPGNTILFSERNPNVPAKKRTGYPFRIGSLGPNLTTDTYVWVSEEQRIVHHSRLSGYDEIGPTPAQVSEFEDFFTPDSDEDIVDKDLEAGMKIQAKVPMIEQDNTYTGYVVEITGMGPSLHKFLMLYIPSMGLLAHLRQIEDWHALEYTPEEMEEGSKEFLHPIQTDLV